MKNIYSQGISDSILNNANLIHTHLSDVYKFLAELDSESKKAIISFLSSEIGVMQSLLSQEFILNFDVTSSYLKGLGLINASLLVTTNFSESTTYVIKEIGVDTLFLSSNIGFKTSTKFLKQVNIKIISNNYNGIINIPPTIVESIQLSKVYINELLLENSTISIFNDRLKYKFKNVKTVNLQCNLGKDSDENQSYIDFLIDLMLNKDRLRAINSILHGNFYFEDYVQCMHFIDRLNIILKKNKILDDLYMLPSVSDNDIRKAKYYVIFKHILTINKVIKYKIRRV